MAMAGETLDFSVCQEVRGAMHDGRLRLSSQNFIFKDTITGRSDTISPDDVTDIYWRRVARGWQLKLRLENGKVKKFDGLKEEHRSKIGEFMQSQIGKEMEIQEMSLKGWNWGKAEVIGDELQFTLDDGKPSFDIPLGNVSNCVQNKNEVTLEFHQNDATNQITMMECRFHMPFADENEDPASALCEKVLDKADVIQAKGSAITQLYKVQCLTPRGRYDVKIYPTFLHLHGKTFDFKLTYTSIIRLFLLPHKDHRQVFFVISVDPPVKQGNARYPFIICLFDKDQTVDLELEIDEGDLKEKYDNKLQRSMSGATFEVVSRLMKAVTSRKITVPGSYKSDQGNNCISCNYRAQTGVLFPLERGFMYLHKPPIYIRFDEIDNVNFARETTKNRSFEFQVEAKTGTKYVFGTIDRNEYNRLFDFAKSHGLKIRNIGVSHHDNTNQPPTLSDDDQDDELDAYAAAIGKDAMANAEDSDESSTDEDFNPDDADPEAKTGGDEEFDSDAADRSTDSEDRGGDDSEGGEKKEKKQKKEKKAKKERKRKPSGDGGEKKPAKKKKEKLPGQPKRNLSSYFMYVRDNREKVIADNAGISVTEITKILGAQWKALTAEEKAPYEEKAAEDKVRYAREMDEFKKNGGEVKVPTKSKKSSEKKEKKTSPAKASSPAKAQGSYKSQETISDDSSD